MPIRIETETLDRSLQFIIITIIIIIMREPPQSSATISCSFFANEICLLFISDRGWRGSVE